MPLFARPPAPYRLAVRAQARGAAAREAAPAPQLAAVVEVSTAGRRRTLPLDGGSEARPALAASLQSADGGGGPAAASGGPVEALKALFLPRGWPGSVTPDYLEYQLW